MSTGRTARERGILETTASKKRAALEASFSGPQGPQALFAGRILSFDEQATPVWAALIADGKAAGRPRRPLDMIIASVGLANDCALVTDNERNFMLSSAHEPALDLQLSGMIQGAGPPEGLAGKER